MRILSVVWFKVLPAKYGGQKGTANFNKHLANHCELTVLAARSNKTDQTLNYQLIPELPNGKLQFINPFTWYKIYKTAKACKAQVIILEYPYHAIAGIIAKKLLKLKLVLHEHNIEFERFKSLHKWWWVVLRRYETFAWRHADLLLFKSEYEKKIASKNINLKKTKSLIIPYGIEKLNTQSSFNIIEAEQSSKYEALILFAGTLDYVPNAKAVEYIFKKLAPALDNIGFRYKIIICGRNNDSSHQWLLNLNHQNVLFAGEVDDIEMYMLYSDVFVVPVLSGGGVQTKIIDALANHLNVVAFEHALVGIDCDLSNDKIWKVKNNSIDQLVKSVVEASKVHTLTSKSFFDFYSHDKILNDLVQTLKKMIS